MATAPPKPSASGAPPGVPGCLVTGCPKAELVVHVREGSAAGPPLAGAAVSIVGLTSKNATTPASGTLRFPAIPSGPYFVSASAADHLPAPASGSGWPPMGGKAEVTLVLAKSIVTQVNATLPGTPGFHKPATETRAVNVLTPSTSATRNLAANPPVILVRGCREVQLEAVTVPAGQPVHWAVEANENSDKPPKLTPTDGGRKATLATNVHGSLSVVATLGGHTVVWNVVFVWVKVDVKSSVVVSSRAFYRDRGSAGGQTLFESGNDALGQYPWQATVDVKIVGGGNSKRLGTDKVKLHCLQNGVLDTLSGLYALPGISATEVPLAPLPIRDSNGAGVADPWMDYPTRITPSNTVFKRRFWTADPPAGSFPTRHKTSLTALQRITGVNGFVNAVASVSDDAPTALMVHASIAWSADFSGSVDAAGLYTATTANTASAAAYTLVSPATGGSDAAVAGFETFEPRFNAGSTTAWVPP